MQFLEQQREFLDAAMELSGHEHPEFLDLVAARLAKGAEEYGENGYLDADCPHETIEEAADIAGWLVLELHKIMRSGDMTGSELLVSASANGIRAYHDILTYRKRRRET